MESDADRFQPRRGSPRSVPRFPPRCGVSRAQSMAAGRRRVRCTTPRTSSGAISTSFSTRPTCMLVCRGCVAMSTGYTRSTSAGRRRVRCTTPRTSSGAISTSFSTRPTCMLVCRGCVAMSTGYTRSTSRGLVLGLDFTLLFEALLITFATAMPVAKVGEIAREHDTRVWRVIENHVARERAKLDFAEVREVGLDETSAAKGQDYITVFMDLLLRRVLFAIEGRDGSTVKAFAADLVAHGGDPELITRTSSDMSNAFIAGVGDNLPNAEMTFDRFHIMKLLSEAVDDVRRVEQRDNPLLKKTRYIWLKHEPNLSKIEC